MNRLRQHRAGQPLNVQILDGDHAVLIHQLARELVLKIGSLVAHAKVRALTRVATPATEERLLGVGRAGTAEHVERIVRGWRRVDLKAEARESAARHRSGADGPCHCP